MILTIPMMVWSGLMYNAHLDHIALINESYLVPEELSVMGGPHRILHFALLERTNQITIAPVVSHPQ
jgi:hypothetical protein